MCEVYAAKPAEADSHSTTASTPPGAIERSERVPRGPDRNSTRTSAAATTSSSGQRRPRQAVRAAEDMSSIVPARRASAPVTTRHTALHTSSTSRVTEVNTTRGAVRQAGRRSSVPYIECSARRNTLAYAYADQIAPTPPNTDSETLVDVSRAMSWSAVDTTARDS